MKSYETHDNGGRPLTVKVSSKFVKIYENIFDDDGEKTGEKLIFTIENPKRVFIGSDPPTEPDEGVSADSDLPIESPPDSFGIGNTILVNTKDNNYIYIQNKIISFTTDSPVTKYFSTVGNSDVPYPYAYTSKHIYFPINRKYINLQDYLRFRKYDRRYKGYDNPYRFLYSTIPRNKWDKYTHDMKVDYIRHEDGEQPTQKRKEPHNIQKRPPHQRQTTCTIL